MPEVSAQVDIPKRALFKAEEVCDLAKVQPYVMRSWETEFPALGIAKGDGPRVYRRTDIEQVLRIKHLLLVEGLTLAGARRRLEEEAAPPLPVDTLDSETRERLQGIRRGLRSILGLLSAAASGDTPKHDPEQSAATASEEPLSPRLASSSSADTAARTGADPLDQQKADVPEQEWLLSDPEAEPASSSRPSRQNSNVARAGARGST